MTGSEPAADPPTDSQAPAVRLRAGCAAATAGDDASAERDFLAVLAACRGTAGELEFDALASLAALFRRQAREMEALRLARRMTDLAEGGDPDRIARAAKARCLALAGLEDWPRVERELRALEAAIASCSPEQQAAHDRAALVLLGRLALQRGDLACAVRHASDAVAASDACPREWTRRAAYTLTAWVAYRRGLFTEGLDAARRAHALAPYPASALESVHVEAICTLEAAGPQDAAAVVRGAIDELEARPRASPAPAHLAHVGPALAELAESCRDDELARRVCDLAAAGMLGRLVEMERQVADLPELREADADDEAALTVFRGRFRERKMALLARLSTYLRPQGGAAFLRSGDDTVRVCAWCVRSLQDDGTWQPFGHVAHAVVGVGVTHGICPSCAAAHPG